MTRTVLLSAALLFMTSSGYAAKFANQFIEFELPPNWDCILEKADWVCQSKSESSKKDTVIIFAAKKRGNTDSLDQYLAHLETSKNFANLQNRYLNSQVTFAKKVEINSQSWVDALHLESELLGFYTRYLATIKDDIGILVTYSVLKAKYPIHVSDFETIAKSIVVFRKPGGLNARESTAAAFRDIQIPTSIGNDSVFKNVLIQGGAQEPTLAPAKKKLEIPRPIVLLAIGALIVFFLLKRRRDD